MSDIFALQLERITPFRREDVCFGWRLAQARRSGPNTLLVQAVVKRDLLVEATERLFKAGFTQVRAACRAPGEPDIALNLPAELSRPRSKLFLGLRAASHVGAFVTLLAMGGLVFTAFAKQHKALAALSHEVGAAQAAAEEVRRTYDSALASGQQVWTLQERRTATPTVAAMLEEVTRVLPDTAWITDFRIDGRQLTITGFAESAADLMPAVEGSDLFANAEFVSPVVRAPREDSDRFNISFQAVGFDTPAEGARQ
ncbi:MAG: PilN domain-containing protein [Rhizobiales bacterium]|nr:PilN domain-containing protein [Hyphomicrobiales bacterium]